MNVFVIHSGADYIEVSGKIEALHRKNFQFNAMVLENTNVFWKFTARAKIRKSQMIVFYLGKNSHQSPYIGWELETAMKYKKPIYVIKLDKEYKDHPVLKVTDKYSAMSYDYGKEIDEETLLNIVSKYEDGNYEIFNEDPEKLDQSVLLEQYKIFLQTSEDLVTRRQNVNNFYISINSALIALFSAMFAIDMDNKYRIYIGFLLTLVGIILSVAWIRTLVSYGNLNSAKMKIITGIEKKLPVSLYDAEWAALSDRLNKKKYISFTDNEKSIPRIFIIAYLMIMIGLLYVFTRYPM
ncbi:MAG: TIR domain-containing protein [Eubacteriales bacterium]|nr:TIR domain-containing protein [Eubacteriales bacterium]